MMRLSGWTLLICTMALWLLTVGPSNAGTITVEQYRDGGAGRILVPISSTLDAGDFPSSMQFDIHYDPQQVQPVEVAAGGAVLSAGKGVSYNVVQPGVVRVITAGLNQTFIDSGIIAEMTFEPVETAASGNVSLTLRNTVMADGNANLIVSHGVDGSIELDVGEQETSGQETSEQETGGLERVLDPIESPTSGDTSVVEPAETMPARVMIPGVIDTVISKQPAGAVPASSQPSTDRAASAGTEPAELRTTVARAPDGVPQEPTGSPTVDRDGIAPSRPVPSSERDVPSEPGRQPTDELSEFELQQETESENIESDKAPSDGSSRRWGIVAIEICAVVVALVLFLGARKLFKV